jgi:hypothetical protein
VVLNKVDNKDNFPKDSYNCRAVPKRKLSKLSTVIVTSLAAVFSLVYYLKSWIQNNLLKESYQE